MTNLKICPIISEMQLSSIDFDRVVQNDLKILGWLERGDGYVDYYEFLGSVIHASKYPGQSIELERKIIQCASLLAPFFENEEGMYSEEPWPWHTEAISQGKYPLDKLPEHVRELARELYYSERKQ